jgi:hypothetical protein
MIHGRCAAILVVACVACEGAGGGASVDAAPHLDAGPPKVTAAPVVTEETKAALALLASEYRGTIGAGVAVVARINVASNANRVTGTYFHESAGTPIALAGSLAGARVTLDETVDGAKTGSLTLEVAPDGTLTGTSTDARGEKPAPVRLEAIAPEAHPKKALVFKRAKHLTRPAKEHKAEGDACKMNVEYAEVYGLPASVEAKINADLAPAPDVSLPDRCEHPLELVGDYRVAYNGDGLLSVRMTTTLTDPPLSTVHGRVLTVALATGLPLKLFGDVVKPKAERTFEAALNQQIEATSRKNNLDAEGRKLLDGALAFSPPFVLEDKGIRLFPDSLPPKYSSLGVEGVVVRYATLPRPFGPAAVLWGK